jgi:ATP-dependent Lhr-like helicase
MTVSSDLIYDVLRQHEPDHILLRAVFADAATGLIESAALTNSCNAFADESGILP